VPGTGGEEGGRTVMTSFIIGMLGGLVALATFEIVKAIDIWLRTEDDL
jgi:hypothetical protein